MILGELETFGSMSPVKGEIKKSLKRAVFANLDENDFIGIKLSLYFSYDNEEYENVREVLNSFTKEELNGEHEELFKNNINKIKEKLDEISKIKIYDGLTLENYKESKEALEQLQEEFDDYTEELYDYDISQLNYDRKDIKNAKKELTKRFEKLKNKNAKIKNTPKESSDSTQKTTSMADQITSIGFGE